jgi:hypothetical protein
MLCSPVGAEGGKHSDEKQARSKRTIVAMTGKLGDRGAVRANGQEIQAKEPLDSLCMSVTIQTD